MRLVIAVILALLPSLINRWLGRRLLAVDDQATLPERLIHLRQDLALPTLLALVGCALLAWGQMPWLFLLLVTGVLASGFTVRKRVYQESWSLAAYLGFVLRRWLGFHGFWVLLAATPLLIRMIDSSAGRWGLAIALAAILGLWSHFSSRVLLVLLRCVPLEGAVPEPYRGALSRIDERSRTSPPDLWLLPMAGGRWPNAVALPSTGTPRVLFSSTLLEALEPEELAAVYAHELGHHEYFTRARLHRLRLLEIALILLAALVAPRIGLLHWLWPLLVLVALLWIGRHRRGWETDADRRALELCGDAETWIRALIRIHELYVNPRRLAPAVEKAQAHPSLARRIQAIRQAAEQISSDASTSAAAGGTAAAPLSLARLGAAAGTAIVLQHDRISWLEDVEAETADGEALLATARANRTVAYRGLVELRVDRGLKGPPVLEATEVDGEKRSFELAAGTAGELQRALDRIDDQLATELKRSGKEGNVTRQGLWQALKSVILWMIIFSLTLLVWTVTKS